MKRVLLCLSLVFAFTLSVYAQTAAEIQVPFIAVTGTAEMSVMPDEIYISVTIRDRKDGKEEIDVATQEAALVSRLREMGIDNESINLSGSSESYITIKRKRKDVVQASTYVIKVKDVQEASAVFEACDEMEIRQCQISRVDHSEIDRFNKELRIKAIKAAKEKAEYLTDAIGSEVGKPLYISAGISRYPLGVANVQINEVALSSRSSNSLSKMYNEIGFEKIKLTYSIDVNFELN